MTWSAKNMQYVGMLRGFTHQYEKPVQYSLKLDKTELPCNEWIGQQLEIKFLDEIRCIHCNRKIKKTYNSGYCYPCFIDLAENDLCIVKPHECHFSQGTCRNEQFAHTYCMVPHYVYLSISSGVKVGLTRKGNQSKRWVDQGAIQAIPIAELPTRQMAGELEFELTQHVRDKTDWRKMLKDQADLVELLETRDELFPLVTQRFQPFLIHDAIISEFQHPKINSPDKIKTYDLSKTPIIKDRLIGIKGNYFIFDHAVINMRKFSGYKVSITIEEHINE